MQFRKIEPYGMWIVLILMFTGLLAKIILPIVALIQTAVYLFMTLLI